MLQVFLGVLSFFILATISQFAIQFSEFDLPSEFLLPMVASRVPEMVLFSLGIAVFLGVIIALNQLNNSHERAIMQAVGLGYSWHMKRLLWLIIPVAALVAWISLLVQPQSRYAEKLTQAMASNQINLNLQQFGLNVFENDADNELMLAIASSDDDARQILIHLIEQGKHYALSASSAQEITQNGKKILLLKNALLFDMDNPSPSISFMQQLSVPLSSLLQKSQPTNIRASHRMQSPQQLWKQWDANSRGELLWRLSFVLNALILPALAVLMVNYRPRKTSMLNYILPLIGLLVYFRLLEFVRQQVSDAHLPALPAYSLFYAGMIVLTGLVWLWRHGWHKRLFHIKGSLSQSEFD